MICQAPHSPLVPLLLAAVLASCAGPPELEHRAISPRLKTKLMRGGAAPPGLVAHDDEVRFHASISGTGPVSLPMTLRNGIPTVPARINGGRALPLIVDTGSQGCLLEARTAAASGVAVFDEEVVSMNLLGTSGGERALLGAAEHVALGGMELRRFPFLVRMHESRLKGGWWGSGTFRWDVIGMNAILPRCGYLTLDFPAGRVVFGMAERFTIPSGGKVWKTPLVMRGGRPYVQLRTGGRTWTALLDSGFDGTLHLDQPTAQRLKLLDRMRPSDVINVGLGAPNSEAAHLLGEVTLDRLDSLGPHMVNIPAAILPQRGSTKVGCALLRPFRVTLDFRRNLLWLEKAL